MNSKSKPVSRLKTKFQPMPMKELLANIQSLPVDLTESSDEDSFGSFVKNTKTVKSAFSMKGSSSIDRSIFDRVHVMPTIEASNSNSVLDDATTRPPILQKKKTDRCLFPEPAKDPSTTYVINSHQKPAKDKVAELCPPSTTYVIDSHQKPAKDKAAELCPPSTIYVIDSHQKPAKDKGAELCPPSTIYVIDSHQKPAKDKVAELCPPSTIYVIDSHQKPAKDKVAELCPPSTTYVIDSHQKPAKDKAAELCPPSTTYVIDNHQKPVKDKAAELCPPSTTYVIDNHQKPATDKAAELCPPSTTYVMDSQQKPIKDEASELCPPANSHVCSHQELAKDKAAELCPMANSHVSSHQEPVNDKTAEKCPPANSHVHSHQESVKDKVADLCPPSNSYVSKASLIPATPTQPQTRTSTVQYKSISINGKKYMYMRLIGSGGSSYVYKVLEIATSNEFALKSVNLTCDPEVSQGYLNEVRVLRDLQASDRVVKLYAYEHVKAAKTLNLVLELGETSLAMFLRRHCEGAPPALVLHYWEEMLLATQQIHAHGIVHADLKPANFLLVSGTLKLIDFGIASKVSNDATSVQRSSEKGTFSYISPEALGGDGSHPIKVSFYSDVWSLGCILYSLVYGQTPFANYNNMLKIMAIQDPNHRINYPRADHIPVSLLSVLKQCLRYNGHSRPTVTELLKHNHIIQDHPSIPEDILTKIQPHLTPREFSILRSAKVTAEALSYAET